MNANLLGPAQSQLNHFPASTGLMLFSMVCGIAAVFLARSQLTAASNTEILKFIFPILILSTVSRLHVNIRLNVQKAGQ
jgi:hypothetical protein